MTMKLKQLLEGYAWERNADGSLPTLKDVAKAHATANQVNEAADADIDRLAITLRDAKDNLDNWVSVNGEHTQLSPILAAISKLLNDIKKN